MHLRRVSGHAINIVCYLVVDLLTCAMVTAIILQLSIRNNWFIADVYNRKFAISV